MYFDLLFSEIHIAFICWLFACILIISLQIWTAAVQVEKSVERVQRKME